MGIPFVKMHGLGNDYIYFNCLDNHALITEPHQLAIELSRAHFGIGADGIVLLLPSDCADVKMRMFNADGSEAEMCGNAVRCIAKYMVDNQLNSDERVSIETLAGIIEAEIIRAEDGSFSAARVAMGHPQVEPCQIDLKGGPSYTAQKVNIGNPHAVIIVDEITDTQVLQHGAAIENHPLFPAKTNVEFVKVIDRQHIQMRVWERGSGETLACGTGASAAAAACIANDLTDKKVQVKLRGGDLEIEQASDGTIYMAGPATTVFSGVLA